MFGEVVTNNLSFFNNLKNNYFNSFGQFLQKNKSCDPMSGFLMAIHNGITQNLNSYTTFVNNLNLYSENLNKILKFYDKNVESFFSRKDIISLNQEIISLTFKTNGQNLVDGAENFLLDMKKSLSKKVFSISTVRDGSFVVGESLATTKGKVVFQNELMQLIAYEPITKDVKEIPILFITAWINKFYVLDLQENNSIVLWLLKQGYRVFMISWINPDSSYKNVGFEDYMFKGVITAINTIKDILKVNQVSCAGYCLGGTLLAVTLAYLAKKMDNAVISATFLGSLVDFEDAGDLSMFINESQISLIESIMEKEGYFDGSYMANTFNVLKSHDMI